MGLQNRSAIAPLVERTTPFTILLPIDAAKRFRSLHDELIATTSAIRRNYGPPSRGIKAGRWPRTTRSPPHSTPRSTFFDPHLPWQRGTNENTNRLIRDYVPKRSDLSAHSPKRIAEVAAELNQLPRPPIPNPHAGDRSPRP